MYHERLESVEGIGDGEGPLRETVSDKCSEHHQFASGLGKLLVISRADKRPPEFSKSGSVITLFCFGRSAIQAYLPLHLYTFFVLKHLYTVPCETVKHCCHAGGKLRVHGGIHVTARSVLNSIKFIC